MCVYKVFYIEDYDYFYVGVPKWSNGVASRATVLSAYLGSNPSTHILFLCFRSSAWIEHQGPNLRVAGSNPVGSVLNKKKV